MVFAKSLWLVYRAPGPTSRLCWEEIFLSKKQLKVNTTDLQYNYNYKQTKAQTCSLNPLPSVTQSGLNSFVAEKKMLCSFYHSSLLYFERQKKTLSLHISLHISLCACVCASSILLAFSLKLEVHNSISVRSSILGTTYSFFSRLAVTVRESVAELPYPGSSLISPATAKVWAHNIIREIGSHLKGESSFVLKKCKLWVGSYGNDVCFHHRGSDFSID